MHHSNAAPFLFRNNKPKHLTNTKSFDVSSPVNDGIAIIQIESERNFRLVSANESFLDIFNIKNQKNIGLYINDIIWGSGENQLQKNLEMAFVEEKSTAFIWHFLSDGLAQTTLCKIILVKNKEGYVTQITVMTANYDDINKLEVEVERNAFYDDLTGLPNRYKLYDLLEKKHSTYQTINDNYSEDNHKPEVAILFINVKRLQRINESYGYEFGDQVLKAAAQQIKHSLHEKIFLSRFENDKFVIYISEEDYTNVRKEASLLAQAIHHEFSTKSLVDNKDIRLSVAIGIASGEADLTDVEELMQNAHLAMKKNHGNNPNQTIIYNPVLKAQAESRLRLETELRDALDIGALELYYQPVINIQNGLLSGFEALARWDNIQRGRISPLEFIAIAEDAGLIIQLGEWALTQSCIQLKSWIDQYPIASSLFVGVNISSTHIMMGNIAALTRDALAKSGLDARNLKLELTESMIMETSDIARNILLDINSLGVSLAVDDFGTGYSSLSYLNRIPADTLKLTVHL
jgi:diguanylate cyclase (GGDEF)-like protein